MKKTSKLLSLGIAAVMSVGMFGLTACGEDKPEEHIHSMNKHNAVAATCIKEGSVEYWSCSDCNKNFKDEAGMTEITANEIKIAFAPHSLTKTDAVDAKDCLTNGNVDYWTCSVCDSIFLDELATDKTDENGVKTPVGVHTLTKTGAVAPTCTVGGNIEYWTCDVCEKLYSDAEGKTEITEETTKLAPAHTTTKVDEVAAKCDENGKEEHYKCTACGELFKDAACTTATTDEELVIAARHILTAHELVKPTWGKDGTKAYWECTNTCGKLYADDDAITEISAEDLIIARKTLNKGDETSENYSDFGDTCQSNGNNATSIWKVDGTKNDLSSGWYNFGQPGNYTGTLSKPTLVESETEKYLQFNSAARFEMFHINKGSGYVHLGEKPGDWVPEKVDAKTYKTNYYYDFDMKVNGEFVLELFGTSGNKPDNTAQGVRLYFEKNTISFYGGRGNTIALRATAQIPDEMNLFDGEVKNIVFALRRESYNRMTFELYINDYLVPFDSEGSNENFGATADGAVEILFGYAYKVDEEGYAILDKNGNVQIPNVGMGQRFSVIPQLKDAGSEEWTTVEIHGFNRSSYYDETIEGDVLETPAVPPIRETEAA